jgi:alginate O-acetyltransferase complex protein AlgI
MLFTQFEFLFLFLPLTFVGYFLIAYLIDAPSARLSWLAVASLVFYSYWDVRFVPTIVISIVFNYAMGLLIARQSSGRARGWVFAAAVAANLFTLGFFKYTNFAVHVFDLIA